MPQDLETRPEAKELQDKYDVLIHYSKDIWSETAAGGFAKKKPELDKPIILVNKMTEGKVKQPQTVKPSSKQKQHSVAQATLFEEAVDQKVPRIQSRSDLYY